MSRIARAPLQLPDSITAVIDGAKLSFSAGSKSLDMTVHDSVRVVLSEDRRVVSFAPGDDIDRRSRAMAGTMRALAGNMAHGLSVGFERRLLLNGIGYRAALSGNILQLTLGFSHPVLYQLPAGVSAELPSQTEIVLRSADKQRLGQTAAELRALRSPEPYKGKGVRYSDETVRRKGAKKK